MPEAVVIPFELKEIPQAIGRAMALSGALDKVADQSERMEKALRSANRAASSSVAIWTRAANAAGAYASAVMLAGAAASGATPSLSAASAAAGALRAPRAARAAKPPKASDPNKTAALPAWKRANALRVAKPPTSAKTKAFKPPKIRKPPKVKPPKAPPIIHALGGPAQALARAQANLAAFGPMGGPAAFDAQLAVKRAQANLAKSRQGPASPLSTLIRSTRFGSGGGIMPLVGRTADVLGPEAMVAIGAIKVAADFVEHALERGARRINAAFTSGDPRSAAQADFLSSALGGSAGASDSFLSRAQSGAGRYYAQKIGISTYQNEYGGGNQNDAQAYVDFIRAYGDPTKTNQLDARMAAKATGTTQEIALSRAASPGVRKMLVDYKAEEMTPSAQMDNADAQIRLSVAMAEFEKTGDRIATKVMPVLTHSLEALEPVINMASDAIAWNLKMTEPYGRALQGQAVLMGRVATALDDAMNRRWLKLKEDIAHLMDPIEDQRKQQSAADKQLEAARKMKEAVSEFKDGVYGRGGARAKASLPGVGMGYDNAAHREAAASGTVVF